MKAKTESMTPSKRRHAMRIRQRRIHFTIHMTLLLILGAVVIGNQQSIMIMLTDIADQSNYIRQEVETLDSTPENCSQVSSEPQAIKSCIVLTSNERDLVERVVAAESRGEDMEGQMAVAQTILDRAELWNMTPAEVVQAPGQYAIPYPGEISDSIKLAVANVFDGGVRVFQEPVTHFYTGIDPFWADGKISRGSIGRHQFYY